MKDKRPIVYVARKLTHFNNIDCLCGYYVSKAYLSFAGKSYEKDGKITKEFIVDFVNLCENQYLGDDFFAETDSRASKSAVFARYADCKYYVNEQNRMLAEEIGRIYNPKITRHIEMHKQSLKHGKKLEEKYISIEEREQISEGVKTC